MIWIDLTLFAISIVGSFYLFKNFRMSFLIFWVICVVKVVRGDLMFIISAHMLLYGCLFYELYRLFHQTISKHLANNFYHELFYARSFITQYSYQINQSLNHIFFLLQNITDRNDLDKDTRQQLREVKQRSHQLAHVLEELALISDTIKPKKVDFVNEFYTTIEELTAAQVFSERVELITPNRPLISTTQHYQCEPHFRSVLVGVLVKIADHFVDPEVPVEILISHKMVFTKAVSKAQITIQTSEELTAMSFDNHYFNYISNDIRVQQIAPQTLVIDIEVELIEQFRSIVTNQITLNRVLIVEDDVGFGRMLQQLFIRRGCEAVHVVDGQAALELISNETFDLILCDIVMPEMSGLKFMKLASYRTTCAIQLMTGYPANFVETTAPIIRKPFDFDQLLYVLRQKGFILKTENT